MQCLVLKKPSDIFRNHECMRELKSLLALYHYAKTQCPVNLSAKYVKCTVAWLKNYRRYGDYCHFSSVSVSQPCFANKTFWKTFFNFILLMFSDINCMLHPFWEQTRVSAHRSLSSFVDDSLRSFLAAIELSIFVWGAKSCGLLTSDLFALAQHLFPSRSIIA